MNLNSSGEKEWTHRKLANPPYHMWIVACWWINSNFKRKHHNFCSRVPKLISSDQIRSDFFAVVVLVVDEFRIHNTKIKIKCYGIHIDVPCQAMLGHKHTYKLIFMHIVAAIAAHSSARTSGSSRLLYRGTCFNPRIVSLVHINTWIEGKKVTRTGKKYDRKDQRQPNRWEWEWEMWKKWVNEWTDEWMNER